MAALAQMQNGFPIFDQHSLKPNFGHGGPLVDHENTTILKCMDLQ
jgi:hypothetical protein